jgi:hypothetical protein
MILGIHGAFAGRPELARLAKKVKKMSVKHRAEHPWDGWVEGSF